MKKYISKILLILSIVFGIGTVYEIIYCVAASNDGIFTVLALLAVCGLFLGLYRIVDLLEKR